jgi:hypothetical protein
MLGLAPAQVRGASRARRQQFEALAAASIGGNPPTLRRFPARTCALTPQISKNPQFAD